MRKILLIFVLLSCSLSMAASTLAQQADSAYNAEDYNRAIELYKASITNHGVSSDIYYNLGNAYYRAGQLGRAVLSYERALRVDPTNGDARTNLDFVRSRIQDRPEDDTAFISSMHHSLMGSLTANTWAWTAFVVFLLFLGAVALYIFSTSVTLRKTGFFGGLVLLFVFLYFLLVAYDMIINQILSTSDERIHALVLLLIFTLYHFGDTGSSGVEIESTISTDVPS